MENYLRSFAHPILSQQHFVSFYNLLRYRPCAPMMTEESVGDIFEHPHGGNEGREGAENNDDAAAAASAAAALLWSSSITKSPYMSFAPRLQPWVVDQFPAIAHVDGTARPQTVERRRNPWLYDLLLRVGAAIGAPLLINTSFNGRGEPIINTARRALELLDSSPDLAFVVIEDWLFRKKTV